LTGRTHRGLPSRKRFTSLRLLDKEGCGWVVEGGNAFCAMQKAAAAKAAKSTTIS